MLGSAAVAEVQRGLAFRHAGFKVDEILQELNNAQDLLEKRTSLPWFLIEEDATMTTTADDPEVALQTGFIRMVDDEFWHYQTLPANSASDRIFLQLVDFDEGLRRTSIRSEVEAEQYNQEDNVFQVALRKNSWYFFPAPTEAITFVGSYYKSDDAIVADAENNWLANIPLLLVSHAGLKMASDLGYAEGVTKFNAMVIAWEEALVKMTLDREQGGRQYQMGRNNL